MNAEHTIVFVEPGSSALVQAVCACGALLCQSGPALSLSGMLAQHIRDAHKAGTP